MDQPDGYAGLASLPLLEGATAAQLGGLADCLAAGKADPGEVLGREGEPGDEFWLLLSGAVKITAATRHGERELAEAGPGSILGELALLRRRPRTATVTAAVPTVYLAGGRIALERLVEIEPVRERIRRLASARLAQDVRPVRADLADGHAVLLRPLLPQDRGALDQALHGLSGESLRRRFFSSGAPSAALVDYLVDIDYVDHFAWVALDAGTHEGMAAARYVRVHGEPSAELAFTTADRFQGRGLGTFLLGSLGVTALEAGVETLVAHVLEDNSSMRRVFAKAAGTSRYDEPGVLLVTIEPGRAAALLDPAVREAIAASVHDIVTAASLALT